MLATASKQIRDEREREAKDSNTDAQRSELKYPAPAAFAPAYFRLRDVVGCMSVELLQFATPYPTLV